MPKLAALGVMSLAFTSLCAQTPPTIHRIVDYPFPTRRYLPVPSKMLWMSMSLKSRITLLNGRYDFNKTDPSSGPSVILDRVLYGYLTSSKELGAVAVLGYHTGGTAGWDYVYAFSLASGAPRLVGWLRAGSRADYGLYSLDVYQRRFDRGPARCESKNRGLLFRRLRSDQL